MNIEHQFPPKLEPLFDPKRYKVLHGGRGGAKSWGVARALLLAGIQQPLRILCAREIQKSMKDSVHRLLRDQIVAMHMTDFYDIFDTEIRGKNGSIFLFAGLQSHTVDSIKSFEGCDRVWVEEAHGVSGKSWDTLIPTIRKPGSEIWMTLNPDMDTDETYQRFIATPSDDTWVCQINWRDNPWFPDVLEQERLKAQRLDPATYEHIWEGKPLRVAEGAIYRHEIDALYADGRVRDVPYDPLLPVHTAWDLGWNDSMVIIMVQRGPQDIRIIDYIEDSNRTLDWYVAQLDKRPYRWGTDFIPHDGRARNFQTGKSTEELLRDMGRKVEVLPMTSIEEGIKALRMAFPKCYFDKTKTAQLVESLKRYRRDVNQRTNEPGAPLHDEFSHGCLIGSTLVLTNHGNKAIKDVQEGDFVWTPAGYARVSASGPVKVADALIEITTTTGEILYATPDHKVFTTNGVLTADALRYNDCLFTQLEYTCLPFQSIELMGYRDALIESFKGRRIGSGQPEICMPARLAEFKDFFTLRFTQPYTENQNVVGRLARKTATCAMSAMRTGFNSARSALESIQFKQWMEFVFIGSQKATTRPITTTITASPCIAMYGRSTMGRYQMASTYTTKTETKPTTQSKTWSYFLRLFTQACTAKEADGLGVKKTESRSSKLENWLKHGTPVQKAKNGTQPMPSKHGKTENGIQLNAKNAAQSSLHHIQKEPSTATRIAKLRRLEGVEGQQLVYDLTVEKHHCYLANGLLVSNCDAARYMAQAVDLMSNGTSKSLESFKNRTRSWR